MRILAASLCLFFAACSSVSEGAPPPRLELPPDATAIQKGVAWRWQTLISTHLLKPPIR